MRRGAAGARARVAALALCVVLLPTVASAAPELIPAEVPSGPSRPPAQGGDGTYIVVLRDPSVWEQLGSLLRRGRTVDLGVRAAGVVEAATGTPRRDLTRLMGAVSAQLDEEALDRLEADPRVVDIIPNIPVRTFERRTADRRALPSTGASPPYLWNLDRVDSASGTADGEYRATTTGAGVDVYVLDTGIRYGHVDFLDPSGTSRLLPASTFTSGYYDATYYVSGRYDLSNSVFGRAGFPRAQDCDLHGTHVAGTTGGIENGIAPGVAIIPVKVFPFCDSGTNYIDDILGGMQWVLVNRRSGRPSVVNMSLGAGPIAIGAAAYLDDAVNALVNAGVVVVAAAGNDGADACTYWPARTPSAITVGSTDVSDARSIFNALESSNFGSCVDVFAPGSDIDSACAVLPTVTIDGVTYRLLGLSAENIVQYDCSTSATIRIGGTSMAAPLVAGLAARHLERFPDATPAQVEAAIVAGAETGDGTDLISDRRAGSPDLLATAMFLEPAGPSAAAAAPIPVIAPCAGGDGASVLEQLPPSGVAPLTWSISEGSLPGTLVLSTRGRITGAGSAGLGSVGLTVTDAFGRSATWSVPVGALPPGCSVG